MEWNWTQKRFAKRDAQEKARQTFVVAAANAPGKNKHL
jgi:hypothetical protein